MDNVISAYGSKAGAADTYQSDSPVTTKPSAESAIFARFRIRYTLPQMLTFNHRPSQAQYAPIFAIFIYISCILAGSALSIKAYAK